MLLYHVYSGISNRELVFHGNTSEVSKSCSYDMNRRYFRILVSFEKYLNIKKVDIKRLKWVLKNAIQFPTIHEADEKAESSTINSITDTSEVMDIIGTYSSFFNFTLLENLIEALEYEEGMKLMETYKSEFSKYINELKVSDCPSNIGIQSPCGSILVKLDEAFKECRVYYINVLKLDICNILGISKDSLYLQEADEGCVCITFHFPLTSTMIFPLTDSMIAALKDLRYENNRILQLQQTTTYSIHDFDKKSAVHSDIDEETPAKIETTSKLQTAIIPTEKVPTEGELVSLYMVILNEKLMSTADHDTHILSN